MYVKSLHLRHERSDEVVLKKLSNVGDEARGSGDVDDVRLKGGVRDEHWRVIINVCDKDVEQHRRRQRRSAEVVADQHHRVVADRLTI